MCVCVCQWEYLDQVSVAVLCVSVPALVFLLRGRGLCPKYVYVLRHVQLFATPWTAARQAPLSMIFSKQEYWSGLPFSPPGDLPDPGIEPVSLVSPALAGGFFTTATPGKPRKGE